MPISVTKERGGFVIECVRAQVIDALRKNAKGYIMIVSFFVAGAILSFLLNISVVSQEEMKLYINDFVSNVKSCSVDSTKTFCLAVNGNIKSIAMLFLMSMCVIGSYGVVAYVFLKGFSYGTFYCVLFNALGVKTAMFFLCSVLLHTIISAPCMMCYSLFCIKNSREITEKSKRGAGGITVSLVYAVLSFFVMCVPALMQAYLEPLIIRISGF